MNHRIRAAGGFQNFLKRVARTGAADITEAELAALGRADAARQFPHLPPDAAFKQKYGSPRATEASRAFHAAAARLGDRKMEAA
jgi:hypothetical protein